MSEYEKLRKQFNPYFSQYCEFKSFPQHDRKLITMFGADLIHALKDAEFISKDDFETLVKGGVKKHLKVNY